MNNTNLRSGHIRLHLLLIVSASLLLSACGGGGSSGSGSSTPAPTLDVATSTTGLYVAANQGSTGSGYAIYTNATTEFFAGTPAQTGFAAADLTITNAGQINLIVPVAQTPGIYEEAVNGQNSSGDAGNEVLLYIYPQNPQQIPFNMNSNSTEAGTIDLGGHINLIDTTRQSAQVLLPNGQTPTAANSGIVVNSITFGSTSPHDVTLAVTVTTPVVAAGTTDCPTGVALDLVVSAYDPNGFSPPPYSELFCVTPN